VIVVATVLFGKRLDTREVQPLAFPLHQRAQIVGEYGSAGTVKLPGTVVLVGIFFIAFVVYYFINWKYLSDLWLFR
jgi:cytochrome c oxidase subunit 1